MSESQADTHMALSEFPENLRQEFNQVVKEVTPQAIGRNKQNILGNIKF